MPASPDPSDLTDVSAGESFLALLSGNADEAMLQNLVTAISAEIVTYCERAFMWQAYTETRNGNGQPAMTLANSPCSSVQSLRIAGVEMQAAMDSIRSATYSTDQIYLRGAASSGA